MNARYQQRRPFEVKLMRNDKNNAVDLKRMNGCDYGFMFDTSGKCRLERINPTAKYNYIWTTKDRQ